MGKIVKIELFSNFFCQTHNFVEFFVGFQNIIKLLKLDKQNLNYRCLIKCSVFDSSFIKPTDDVFRSIIAYVLLANLYILH